MSKIIANILFGIVWVISLLPMPFLYLFADKCLHVYILTVPGCLVVLCVNKIRADYLITRDCKGFRNSLVPTLSPAGWLAEMRKQGKLTFNAVN